ncbi:hypothetical protein ES703_102383 [subsurface metagenome]
MLVHGITNLSIECLPDSLPSQVEADISSLEDVGQAIHVKDIVLAPEITVHADPDQLVVKISEAAVKEVVEEVVAEVEGEVSAEVAAETPTEKATEQQTAE